MTECAQAYLFKLNYYKIKSTCNISQEYADALKQFSPKHASVREAEDAAQELEEVKRRLDRERKEKEERMKQEQAGEITAKKTNKLN